MLRALGALYAQGQPVDWGALDPSGQFLRLPSYPWQRERHWLEAEAPSRAPRGNGTSTANGATARRPMPTGTSMPPRPWNGENGAHAARTGRSRTTSATASTSCNGSRRIGRPRGPSPAGQEGTWLIFEDAQGVGRAVRSLLEARGASCVVVTHADTSSPSGAGGYRLDPADPVGFRRLFEDVLGREPRPLRGVVHLWSLDSATAGRGDGRRPGRGAAARLRQRAAPGPGAGGGRR